VTANLQRQCKAEGSCKKSARDRVKWEEGWKGGIVKSVKEKRRRREKKEKRLEEKKKTSNSGGGVRKSGTRG